jgi:chromosome segregation ATPase
MSAETKPGAHLSPLEAEAQETARALLSTLSDVSVQLPPQRAQELMASLAPLRKVYVCRSLPFLFSPDVLARLQQLSEAANDGYEGLQADTQELAALQQHAVDTRDTLLALLSLLTRSRELAAARTDAEDNCRQQLAAAAAAADAEAAGIEEQADAAEASVRELEAAIAELRSENLALAGADARTRAAAAAADLAEAQRAVAALDSERTALLRALRGVQHS